MLADTLRQNFNFTILVLFHFPISTKEQSAIKTELLCSIKTQFMSCRDDIFVQLNDKNCQKKRQ